MEYVAILHDMVRRNLPAGFGGRFVCLTDRPADLKGLAGVDAQRLTEEGLEGWWPKMTLFKGGSFPEGDRVWYFDLDTCVTGPLDSIFSDYDGPFAILRDAYRPGRMQSSVMSWKVGAASRSIWESWDRRGRPHYAGGDQAAIEAHFVIGRQPDFLQARFPGRFHSYKVSCQYEVPKRTSVVFFHGLPRPHQVLTGWVPHVWKVGGGTAAELVAVGTVAQDKVVANAAAAIARGYPSIERGEPIERLAVICAGGPSLADQGVMIASLQSAGAAVFAVNQVDGYLRDHGILPNFHVMLDARPDLAAWVNAGGIKLYASQCDPATLERANEMGDLTLWHSLTPGIEEIIKSRTLFVGGGSTVGTRAVCLAYILGFRNMALVGFDSCYTDDAHHAYPQALNDQERVLDVICAGRAFKAAAWMVKQAEEFKEIAAELADMGCQISIFGDGLLPHMLEKCQGMSNAADERGEQILEWINDIPSPHGVEVGVFGGDLSKRLLRRRDLSLDMVDSWEEAQPDGGYSRSGDFHASLDQNAQDAYMQRAMLITEFAASRRRVIRMRSVVAATHYKNESLDFVFLDADHSYEAVQADIAAWLPKVRPGGILCGHDYANEAYPLWGVARAVDEAFGPQVELGKNYTWRIRVGTSTQSVKEIS